MKIRNSLIASIFAIVHVNVNADEGLWIPMLLQHYNIDIMQKQGLKLSAEDIYSINQASLKDAVVIFGGGCTGELISAEGLLLTNHHCGFGSIQSLSSVGNDYLTNGFWAMNRDEELPNKGLKVTFLIRIEDVTSKVLDSVSAETPEEVRDSMILARVEKIRNQSVENTNYLSVIKPFYYGNEFYMFIYKEYTDIRLVGAPPGSIGNYGEDLDNWMWPRHTGDFSLFRIYAGKNNEPAPYSPENVPYKPEKFLSLSADGVKEGDFTMVMGYPGTTNEYIISDEISLMMNSLLPRKIAVRETRLKIIDKYMKQNDTTRIMYASKYRSISNAWKKWQGVIIGLESTKAIEKKESEEYKFQNWTEASPERFKKYGSVLPDLKKLNSEISRYSLVYEYFNEAVMAAELLDFALDCNSFFGSAIDMNIDKKTDAATKFKITVNGFFKNFNPNVDEEIFASMLQHYFLDIDPAFHPAFFNAIQKKYKGNFKKFADDTYKKSVFCNKEALFALLDQFPLNSDRIYNQILNDPVIEVYREYETIFLERITPDYRFLNIEMQTLYRTYLAGIMEMNQDKVFYPDANFTMRVAYGKVQGYKPQDGIIYEYATTLSGIMEKFKADSINYSVPQKLSEIFINRDFGPWTNESGDVPVCFVASNHTSGGNSGSPVLNANGHLIGINFDRNWEGTMSDIYYDVSICRNIAVDIRYVLFIIDKYAGAGYLINEMDIIDKNKL